MKKFAALAVAALACSFSAMAGTFTISGTCTPFTFPFSGGAGSGSLSCPSFASLGAAGAIDIASATLNLFGDYQAGNPTTTNVVSETFNLSSGVTGLNAGIGFASSPQTLTETGGFSSGGSVPASPFADAASSAAFGTAASLAQWTAFSVGVSSVINSGSVTTSSAGAIITFTYDTANTSPEPVSLLLFGSGLLAVSLIGRKKFARK